MSWFRYVILAVIYFASSTLFSQSSEATIKKNAHSRFSKWSQNARQSVLFVRARDGRVLFESGAKHTLIPASVTKLVTAAAALTLATTMTATVI